jgi:pentatricopeptide repeat protein
MMALWCLALPLLAGGFQQSHFRALRPTPPSLRSLRLLYFDRNHESRSIEELAAKEGVISVIARLQELLGKDDDPQHVSNVQFVATKAIMSLGRHGAYHESIKVLDLLQNNVEKGPDVHAFTAAMTVQIRANRFEQAWDMFESMKETDLVLDEVAYVCGVRAAGFLLPWEATMEIAAEALTDVGPGAALSVAHTAMTNLMYLRLSSQNERLEVLAQAYQMVAFLQTRSIVMNEQTVDIVLGVASYHGGVEEVLKALNLFSQKGFKPTQVTFNTLLGRCARGGQLDVAMMLLHILEKKDMTPDATTYNSLIKLSVKNEDASAARAFFAQMKSAGILPDEFSYALMVQALALDGHVTEALALLGSAPDEALGPHAFSVMIRALDGHDWKEAVKLLQRAVKVGRVDQGVFTAAAKECLLGGESSKAFSIIENMLGRGFAVNKFTLSFLISMCLGDHDPAITSTLSPCHSGEQLETYLLHVAETVPQLITSAVCQRVVSHLAISGDWKTAARLHLTVFRDHTCKTETLSKLFLQMQKSAEKKERNKEADLALDLLQLYLDMPPNQNPTIFRKHLLRTEHFNSVIRILSIEGRSSSKRVQDLFMVMSASDEYVLSHPFTKAGSHNGKAWSWKPSTFTVAELVRYSKSMDGLAGTEFCRSVLAWGTQQGTYIPLGVVSDAVSGAYDQGFVEEAQSMYDLLYIGKKVQHWALDDPHKGRMLELHDFSRAMAHCAIASAVREMSAASDAGRSSLTVITGKVRPSKYNSEEEINQGRISMYIQQILVDSFFPPMSSMTVVNNPGRLVIPPEEFIKRRELVTFR